MPRALDLARAKPESLKGRILRAARRIFAMKGYHGASTRAIASEVGIDVSTLYYHWGSKEDLFQAVLQDIELDFEERLRAWVHRTKDRPLDECFDLAAELFGTFFQRDVVRVVLFSFFDDEFAGKGWAVESQRRLVATIRTFVEKRFGPETIPPEFDASVIALIASTLALVGSRTHVADILGMDAGSEEYRQLTVATWRRLAGAFVSSLHSTR